jgi:hypothetical protein
MKAESTCLLPSDLSLQRCPCLTPCIPASVRCNLSSNLTRTHTHTHTHACTYANLFIHAMQAFNEARGAARQENPHRQGSAVGPGFQHVFASRTQDQARQVCIYNQVCVHIFISTCFCRQNTRSSHQVCDTYTHTHLHTSTHNIRTCFCRQNTRSSPSRLLLCCVLCSIVFVIICCLPCWLLMLSSRGD